MSTYKEVREAIKWLGIDRWIFEIPLSDVRVADESKKESSCILCGKVVKNKKYFVHLLSNGNLVSTSQDMENSQGFFPIGTECIKHLPNNFIFK